MTWAGNKSSLKNFKIRRRTEDKEGNIVIFPLLESVKSSDFSWKLNCPLLKSIESMYVIEIKKFRKKTRYNIKKNTNAQIKGMEHNS